MKVLVTGGAGFIGSHLVKRLVREGEEVTVLDNFSTGRRENLDIEHSNGRIRLVEGDIRNREDVRASIQDSDCVVHLAAIASVPYSIRNPLETRAVNVDGTVNILEASVEEGVRKVVYASSCAVYGEPLFVPVPETHPVSSTAPYSETKIAAETYCKLYRDKHDLDTICLRAFNVYGPGQHNSDYGGVMTQFIGKLKRGERVVINGDGEQTRDFIHVDDLVEGIELALRTKKTGLIYNLGTGHATTINQLAARLEGIFGMENLQPIQGPARLGDVKRSQAEISLATRELAFRPRITLQEGLEVLARSETCRVPMSQVIRSAAMIEAVVEKRN